MSAGGTRSERTRLGPPSPLMSDEHSLPPRDSRQTQALVRLDGRVLWRRPSLWTANPADAQWTWFRRGPGAARLGVRGHRRRRNEEPKPRQENQHDDDQLSSGEIRPDVADEGRLHGHEHSPIPSLHLPRKDRETDEMPIAIR